MPMTVRLMPHTIGSTAIPWARRRDTARRQTPASGADAPGTAQRERRTMGTPGTELETVNLQVSEGVATIELNRPHTLNAWNTQFGSDLLEAVRRVGDDDAVRAVVITGAGRGFSSG